MERRCPNCGNQLSSSDKECPRCVAGEALPWGEESSPAPSEPAKSSGLAIAALVVGILAVPTAGILSLPGLVLGIGALTRAGRSQERTGGEGLAWSGIALSCVGLMIFGWLMATRVYPKVLRAGEAQRAEQCLANTHDISTGLMMYAADHDEKLPPWVSWSDALKLYVPSGRDVFICPDAPQLRSGYAYNQVLNNMSLTTIGNPGRLVMLYESKLGWNGAGGPQTLLSPDRHFGRGNAIGFADGTATRVRVEQDSTLVWEPTAAE